MKDKFYLFLYNFLLIFFYILPKFARNFFINLLAICFYKFDKKHTKIIKANLKFCFKDYDDEKIEKLILNTYKNFGFFGVEFLLNQNESKEEILKKVSFENEHFATTALKSGRPVIMQTAHYGNWELAALVMSVKFGKSSVVGRALDSAVMNKILNKLRTRFDIELIDKKNAAKNIIKALKDKRLLGILVDQHVSINEGIECKFFDNQIIHTQAASVFASKLNALILPAFIQRENENYKIIFYPVIDIKQLEKTHLKQEAIYIATQAQSDATMAQIIKKPDEYFWFHKKFKHFNGEIYA